MHGQTKKRQAGSRAVAMPWWLFGVGTRRKQGSRQRCASWLCAQVHTIAPVPGGAQLLLLGHRRLRRLKTVGHMGAC
jgi:hypothetical protein